MNKKNKIIGIIIFILIIIIAIPVIANFDEYITTVKRIKNSECYSKNEFIINYVDKSFTITIPKGLGDVELRGNVVHCFKSLKSVNKIKKEFEELYGKDNIKIDIKENKYYYKNPKNNYIMTVSFLGGFFTDVFISDVKALE